MGGLNHTQNHRASPSAREFAPLTGHRPLSGEEPQTLCDLLARRPRTAAARAAIVASGRATLSHEELDIHSDRFARRLLRAGAGADTVVGVALPRGSDFATVVVGILKSGAICLPLDPKYPDARLLDMIAESGAGMVVTDLAGTARFAASGAQLIRNDDAESHQEKAPLSDAPPLADELFRPIRPPDIAFLLFTSGSSGRPKGVPITHAALANKLVAHAELFRFGEDAVFAHTSSVGFDPSLHQLLLPLASGGTCVVFDEEELTQGKLFWSRVAEAGVTHLDLVPSYAAMLRRDAGAALPGQLRFLIFGGEALNSELLDLYRAIGPGLRIFNMYGPTEACIDAMGDEVTQAKNEPITIGRALAGYNIYLLDSCLRPVPPGAPGEIYIAGRGLAPGYWRQPELTAARFIANPFGAPGERMYRTGDIGRRLLDGRIEFLGRGDEQIKIRGVRIEPGDIESALSRIDGVRHSAVVCRTFASRKVLAAYVVLVEPDRADTSAIRKALAELLPGNMLPDSITILEAFPVQPSGKIDRKRLPEPSIAPCPPGTPATATEQQVQDLFAEITGFSHPSRSQSFFEIGGDSLSAMWLQSEIRSRFGRELPLRAIFENPTVESIAALIESGHGGASGPLLKLAAGTGASPLFCVHAVSGMATIYRNLADALGAGATVYGLQATNIESTDEPPRSIHDMARIYIQAIRHVQPNGPYRLLGWSFGGTVAHEMARQLEARGEKVAAVFLLDTYFALPADDAELSERGEEAGILAQLACLPKASRDPWAVAIAARTREAGELLAQHLPGRIEARLIYIRASDNANADLASDLSDLSSGPAFTFEVPISHYAFSGLAAAREFAEIIRPQLTLDIFR